MTEEFELIKPEWGDIMVFQHTNVWGELCQNVLEYTYAGAKGKYPNYNYRFARIGSGSISPDKFEDIYINSSDMILNKKIGLNGCIREYTRIKRIITDDMVERATIAIRKENSGNHPGQPGLSDMSESVQEFWRRQGRVALQAALGGDDA